MTGDAGGNLLHEFYHTSLRGGRMFSLTSPRIRAENIAG